MAFLHRLFRHFLSLIAEYAYDHVCAVYCTSNPPGFRECDDLALTMRGFAIPRSATRVKRNTMQSGHAIQRATAMREERAFVPSPSAALSRFCSGSHCIKRLQFATAKMLIPLEISSGGSWLMKI